MSPQIQQQLLTHRNKSVAKTLYRKLRAEGYSHEEIIDLSGRLLELVTEEVRDRAPEAR